MCELYNKIQELCIEKHITITQMCKESGANRASLTDLKMGRKQSLSAETLGKIADYFDVSVDYLLGKTDIKKAPGKKPEVSDEDIQFALFGGKVDDEAYEEVKSFAKFVKEKYKNKGK